MKMIDPKVTREQFQTYVVIRDSGITNMYDVQTVCKWSDGLLNKDNCFYIMKNFCELAKYYDVKI